MKITQLITVGYRILRNEGVNSFINKSTIYIKYKQKNMSLYEIYLQHNEINDSMLDQMKNDIRDFKYNPKISIITPVYNVDKIWLEKAINSVTSQIYENWELCLVDDASTNENTKKTLGEFQRKDHRIKVKYLKDNHGISEASNEALALSTGEFVGLMDHDDELAINALYEVVKLLQEHPNADMIYSDEDKMDTKGKRCDPYFKPDWSPDLFLSNMYVSHFGIYRRNIVEKIGGFRKGYEGSQDYDLVLRFTEKTTQIYHIPKIFYHWRQIPGSTAERYEAKGYADINAVRALEDALVRRNINGKVVSGKFPSSFRVKRHIKGNPKVCIIIPTKDRYKTLKTCIESILEKTSYDNYEIMIVDNNSKDDAAIDYLKTISKLPRIKTIYYDKIFNFSAINNFAIRHSESEYILFLNNDTEIISDEWLTAMLEHAQRDNVGAVGCKLLYPDNTIQHAGVILGITGTPSQSGVAGHSHKHLPNTAHGYFGRPHIIHNISAVTAACLIMRKDVFEDVGGFDENLAVAFNDVDLCLKIRDKGYLIVYTPYAELYHHESVSRGYEDTPEKQRRFSKEVKYIRDKWGKVIDRGDPYYNPNLSLNHEDYAIKINVGK